MLLKFRVIKLFEQPKMTEVFPSPLSVIPQSHSHQDSMVLESGHSRPWHKVESPEAGLQPVFGTDTKSTEWPRERKGAGICGQPRVQR